MRISAEEVADAKLFTGISQKEDCSIMQALDERKI